MRSGEERKEMNCSRAMGRKEKKKHRGNSRDAISLLRKSTLPQQVSSFAPWSLVIWRDLGENVATLETCVKLKSRYIFKLRRV